MFFVLVQEPIIAVTRNAAARVLRTMKTVARIERKKNLLSTQYNNTYVLSLLQRRWEWHVWRLTSVRGEFIPYNNITNSRHAFPIQRFVANYKKWNIDGDHVTGNNNRTYLYRRRNVRYVIAVESIL